MCLCIHKHRHTYVFENNQRKGGYQLGRRKVWGKTRENSWEGLEEEKKENDVILFQLKTYLRAGEWAQGSKALVLAEDPPLIASTHAVAHSHM